MSLSGHPNEGSRAVASEPWDGHFALSTAWARLRVCWIIFVATPVKTEQLHCPPPSESVCRRPSLALPRDPDGLWKGQTGCKKFDL